MRLFAVYDIKLGAFQSPFAAPTDGAAIRAFSDEVQRDGSPMNRHREDYTLSYVAFFDEETGHIQQEQSPRRLLAASEV